MSDGAQRWALASTALSLLKADPSLKGILVGTSHGPVYQAYVTQISELFPITRIPVSVSNERLNGGLDISMTLSAGKPVYHQGLLDTADGVLLVNSAERLDTTTTSALSAHLDNPDAPETLLIVIDESTDDEMGLATSTVADRLAMMIELPALPLALLQALVIEKPASADSTPNAIEPNAIEDVNLPDSLLQELTLLANRLGVDSLRALLFATRVARGHAALHGRDQVIVDDAAIAAQLVLAPRATTLDQSQDTDNEEPEEPLEQDDSPEEHEPAPDTVPEDQQRNKEPENDNQDDSSQDIGEQLLEAASTTLPQNVIADLVRGQKNNRNAGRDANASGKGQSGRPTGVRRPRGALRSQRLNIVETLKAAAPKQKLRDDALNANSRLKIRLEDFRVTRYKQPTSTTTVFVVDASGSSAMHRLAEAKGAVELLLAECYVRRDRVAMISFKGLEARLELPPTRSLVRAKRELAGLPGGGGTPLAAGLDLANQVVQQLTQAGETPVIVVMTDAKANIARDGQASRVQAMEDAHESARRLASTGVKCLFIDTAPRARPQARELAHSLQARYLPLPSVDSQNLPDLIRA